MIDVSQVLLVDCLVFVGVFGILSLALVDGCFVFGMFVVCCVLVV